MDLDVKMHEEIMFLASSVTMREDREELRQAAAPAPSRPAGARRSPPRRSNFSACGLRYPWDEASGCRWLSCGACGGGSTGDTTAGARGGLSAGAPGRGGGSTKGGSREPAPELEKSGHVREYWSEEVCLCSWMMSERSADCANPIDPAAVERATKASIYRSCDVRNLGN
jgi:hypothetical protein